MRDEQSSEAIHQAPTTETASDIGQTAKLRSESTKENDGCRFAYQSSGAKCLLLLPGQSNAKQEQSNQRDNCRLHTVVIFNVEVRLV